MGNSIRSWKSTRRVEPCFGAVRRLQPGPCLEFVTEVVEPVTGPVTGLPRFPDRSWSVCHEQTGTGHDTLSLDDAFLDLDPDSSFAPRFHIRPRVPDLVYDAMYAHCIVSVVSHPRSYVRVGYFFETCCILAINHSKDVTIFMINLKTTEVVKTRTWNLLKAVPFRTRYLLSESKIQVSPDGKMLEWVHASPTWASLLYYDGADLHVSTLIHEAHRPVEFITASTGGFFGIFYQDSKVKVVGPWLPSLTGQDRLDGTTPCIFQTDLNAFSGPLEIDVQYVNRDTLGFMRVPTPVDPRWKLWLLRSVSSLRLAWLWVAVFPRRVLC